ncbi:hypothetical protein KC330_g7641 [Hortaea werneckii]|nr:hypothetical protein KC330_g7641 [Hortaea werneckii]
MLRFAPAAVALLASVAFAAPAPAPAAESTVSGPPVVYQTAAAQPLVTATTLAEPAATAASKAKRDADTCYPQPTGIGHHSSPDTGDAFRADSYYSSAANSAQTPPGFNAVFTNTGASPNADQYLGYTLLDTYDVQTCADKCNGIKDCKSFNIYFERDPSVNPDSDTCANPPSVTNIKCVWWGSTISSDVNVNKGQWRNQFEVVIAGSNGYVGTPTQRGFRIKTDGSGTEFDQRYLAVSPGEGAAVALNEVWYKEQSSVFQFGADGSLLEIAPFPNMAGVSPNSAGTWAPLQYKAVGNQGQDYIRCSGDNLISCQSKSGWQYAGVCPKKPANKRGLLYWGLPEKKPKDCKWIGLYIDTDI